MLPSFALAYKTWFVFVVEQWVGTLIEHQNNWTKWLDISLELDTAYRWLRQLKSQIQATLPIIREKILHLAPNSEIISKPTVGPLSEYSLFENFLLYGRQLQQLALSLSESELPSSTNLFCFLNVFLYQQTGKPLLVD